MVLLLLGGGENDRLIGMEEYILLGNIICFVLFIRRVYFEDFYVFILVFNFFC